MLLKRNIIIKMLRCCSVFIIILYKVTIYLYAEAKLGLRYWALTGIYMIKQQECIKEVKIVANLT